ncbi:N-acetylmuramoyl-L-alanine amidase [Bacillus methanolicus PB1]|uniref:N-acetylmuramoyl-L-alanine amidase n=1 Tax=Bacillus methanolicus PB1 TaxID=997296 RepID=I3DXY1_BACMT|nr:N-acetylmuramoyl-L-alanine amidase [Bacillus methanolicus]EIJ79102.1 N-acetylmuramoyl-L-alanine amidase [Bacillus methanolicus PB1]
MFKISLSAGHAKTTPGKQTPDGTIKEWEFNSAVVKYLMAGLANYENVAFLRLDDPTGQRDIPLQERSDRANAWGANVHIDIHANANGSTWNDARGIETFVYLTRPKEAVALAEKVQANLIKATGLQNRGVKAGDFHMLRETKMTAILVEAGFMTNREEAKLLKSDNYRRIVAGAILASLVEQYCLKKKSSPKPPTTKTPSKQGSYKVQVGAFSEKANAERLAYELKKKGYPAIVVKA